jgi:uncharacterized membrane protein YqgA involved in biofilm formation
MMTEMTATGGVISDSDCCQQPVRNRHIRVGNFLPALLVAPLLVALLAALGVNWILP